MDAHFASRVAGMSHVYFNAGHGWQIWITDTYNGSWMVKYEDRGLENAKTDYDAHCTVGVVIAFAFFWRAGAPYPQQGEG